MSSSNKVIEEYEQYCGIREYRNELRDEYDMPTVAMRWHQIQALRDRIKELDDLLNATEEANPTFEIMYLTAPNLGTY